jgi:hypothetical protein
MPVAPLIPVFDPGVPNNPGVGLLGWRSGGPQQSRLLDCWVEVRGPRQPAFGCWGENRHGGHNKGALNPELPRAGTISYCFGCFELLAWQFIVPLPILLTSIEEALPAPPPFVI